MVVVVVVCGCCCLFALDVLLFLCLLLLVGCFVVLWFCCFVLVAATTTKEQHKKNNKTLFIVFLFVGFGGVVVFLVFLFLLVFGVLGCCFVAVFGFVLIVVGVGCFVVVLVWNTPTKENTNIKSPCFIVFSCALVLTGLWPQKGQQPKAPKKSIFFFLFSPKILLSAERSVGFRVVIVFLYCLCFLLLGFGVSF